MAGGFLSQLVSGIVPAADNVAVAWLAHSVGPWVRRLQRASRRGIEEPETATRKSPLEREPGHFIQMVAFGSGEPLLIEVSGQDREPVRISVSGADWVRLELLAGPDAAAPGSCSVGEMQRVGGDA